MNIQDIAKEYKYKTELHAHSSGISYCSEICGEELLKRYSKRGADSVVITNHMTPEYFAEDEAEEFAEKYVNEYKDIKKLGDDCGINVILGLEIRFTENINDYLVYGFEEDEVLNFAKSLKFGIDGFYKKFKNKKNLILQAHPFRDGMSLANPKSIDGIEVFNMHPNQNSRVASAAKYAKEQGFKISGATDFHHPGHEGCCFLRTKFKPQNSFEIAEVLKSGDFVFDISENIVLPYYFKG